MFRKARPFMLLRGPLRPRLGTHPPPRTATRGLQAYSGESVPLDHLWTLCGTLACMASLMVYGRVSATPLAVIRQMDLFMLMNV